MATNVQVPAVGESITEAVLLRWYKKDGEAVKADEPICELETDKANVDVPSPTGGVFRRLKAEGEMVKVGETIATVDGSAAAAANVPAATVATASSAPAATPPPAAAKAPTPPKLMPSALRLAEEKGADLSGATPTGPRGHFLKGDVMAVLSALPATAGPGAATAPVPAAARPAEARTGGDRREPMSKLRRRIAERLVAAQQETAMLTTFNEIDCSAVLDLRKKYKEAFEKRYGVGLGLMSLFTRAAAQALEAFPEVNAFIDGDDIVYHDYVNMGIAVSTDRGLVVPVVRDVTRLSLGGVELEIKRVAKAAREGKLGLAELSGGTFTITNGGVFGSLMSTPILNRPQSGILGMHAIKDRPVAVDGAVVVRPMMYVALSYDHRIIDGAQSVGFLVRVKELLEDPARMLLEI